LANAHRNLLAAATALVGRLAKFMYPVAVEAPLTGEGSRPMNRPQRKRPITGLDIIRFFAAFLVMTYHLAFWSWAVPYEATSSSITHGIPAFPSLTWISWFGGVGVDIFFVLSGFVILYSADRDSRSFARSRVLRLVPGALVSASLTAVTLLTLNTIPASSVAMRFLRSIFFIPYGPWIDGVYWTLGIEIVFYAAIFLLLNITSVQRLRFVLYPIGIVSSAFWLMSAFFGLNAYIDATFGAAAVRALQLLLVYHGNLFAIGGLLWASLLGRRKGADLFVIALCVGTAMLHIANDKAWEAEVTHSTVAVPILIWATCVVGIVLSVRFNDQLSRVIPGQFARNIGIATYPLYLINDIIGAVFLKWGYALTSHAEVALAVAMLATCALAVSMAAFAEPPIRAMVATAFDHIWQKSFPLQKGSPRGTSALMKIADDQRQTDIRSDIIHR
jgi:peptidoglycan/LPS O-acetylase OafA/YrhL